MPPEQQLRLTFQPSGRSVYVLPGTKVLEAAARAGMTIDTPCGGKGTCGKCRVQVLEGACDPGDQDRKIFSRAELAEGWRLACQTSVRQESVLLIPESSIFASQHQILTEAQTEEAAEVLPAVRKVYVELPEPTLAEDAADLERLQAALGPLKADVGLLRQLPALLRSNGFKGTAVLTDHRLI
ncbi:MAG TPA: 2Fe-2S iron-sulfur cluster-binding protein, partial [Phycisphaerae bacterium]|nr:2Fe-2S iron-sulfur cluster-binding protein [Phycisphaerae bacterium]